MCIFVRFDFYVKIKKYKKKIELKQLKTPVHLQLNLKFKKFGRM